MTPPLRTCIGCRGTAPKGELLRIVWEQGPTKPGPRADPRQVAPGRGAYLHRSGQCLGLAVKRRALGRALRVSPIDPAALTEAVGPYVAG